MLVSIQFSPNQTFKVWDEVQPVVHQVDAWNEAVEACYIMSRHFGGSTARLVKVPNYLTDSNSRDKLLVDPESKEFRTAIGNCSGTYILGRR